MAVALIPIPVEMTEQAGEFVLTPETVIVADVGSQEKAVYLRDLLAPPTGFALPIQAEAPAHGSAIRLSAGWPDAALGREGYVLDGAPRRMISIAGPDAAGVFYGIQTLRQLLPSEIERRAGVTGVTWRVPCVTIRDFPRFGWRGHMLDVGRHFHDRETILHTLDLMALQKLNVFHWHLTEDQGWRIEIKQYPRLTEVGSRRAGTSRLLWGKHNNIPHEGCYTQDEVREIVAYAAARNITVVPEIETPGHSRAALAAYPELSCTGGPFEVACHFGIFQDIYCAGKESVFTVLQSVLDEVMALFPSPFIHIGGDEAPKRRWKKCPACQQRIRQEGLKDEHHLQRYLTDRVAAYLAAHGRRIIGWNDMLGDDLVDSAVVQYWVRGRQRVIEAARHGRDVVVSSMMDVYLDHSYSLIPLSKTYAFEPVFAGLDAEGARHILGLEAPLWCEFVPNRARLDYQTYPRLTAVAETGWSAPNRKDYGDFRRRLVPFLRRLEEHGVGYAPAGDWDSSWLRRKLGLLTIVQPKTRTAA